MSKTEPKIDLDAMIRREDPRIAGMRAELTGLAAPAPTAVTWTREFAASGGKQPTPPTPPPGAPALSPRV